MTSIMVAVLVASAVGDILLVIWLFRNALLNPRQVDLEHFQPASTRPLEVMRAKLAGEPWLDLEPMDRCLAAMRWTMNKVHRIEVNGSRSPDELMTSVEAGSGALCGDMATLMSHVLAAVNIDNRMIFLARNIFDTGDVHALVEAHIAGRWIAFDPTFNLTFHSADGASISAQDCKQILYKKGASGISTRFHGEVNYPARQETYYADLFVFFNNVLVLEVDPRWLGVLPVRLGSMLRPLKQSRSVYYQNAAMEGGAHLQFMRNLYLVAIYLAGRVAFWALLVAFHFASWVV